MAARTPFLPAAELAAMNQSYFPNESAEYTSQPHRFALIRSGSSLGLQHQSAGPHPPE
jgi:hypothetical protein